jgi:hypothetical protein
LWSFILKRLNPAVPGVLRLEPYKINDYPPVYVPGLTTQKKLRATVMRRLSGFFLEGIQVRGHAANVVNLRNVSCHWAGNLLVKWIALPKQISLCIHCLAFFDYSGILQMSGKFPAGWTIGGLT